MAAYAPEKQSFSERSASLRACARVTSSVRPSGSSGMGGGAAAVAAAAITVASAASTVQPRLRGAPRDPAMLARTQHNAPGARTQIGKR